MRNVYTIGETVFDIVLKNNTPIIAQAGGSMLNTAVSLGRLKIPTYLISEYGDDIIGKIIDDFLLQNNINTKYSTRYTDGQTTIAIALLDEFNNATYSFYKILPSRLFESVLPPIKENDIVMFGSFFSLTDRVRENLLKIINYARKNNALVLYDPNFRKPHLSELKKVLPFIRENISLSDMILASNEDFLLMFNSKTSEEANYIVNKYGAKILLYTKGKDDVVLMDSYNNLIKNYPVPQIETLSTIGAGDTFNAGIIYGLIKNNITYKNIKNINEEKWDNIVNYGIKMASYVCQKFENYISEEFVQKFL